MLQSESRSKGQLITNFYQKFFSLEMNIYYLDHEFSPPRQKCARSERKEPGSSVSKIKIIVRSVPIAPYGVFSLGARV
jgi:hypothetical protein